MEPIFIKEFLPNKVLNFIYSYCVIKFSNSNNFEIDPQTKSLVAVYGDPVMETLLDSSTPVIEQNVGKKLWPTYSYFRIYDKESDLKIHIDRESCEYTVALCLGADPSNNPYEIFLGEQDETSDYKYLEEETHTWMKCRIDYKYPMVTNNALIFKGMDKLHWREKCVHDHFITVFLHYVDQEGEFKEFKYDKRKFLGLPQNK
jgi:hypothetical protein